MDSHTIRSRFLKFFEGKGHKIVPSSSLVPENDSSVLFTTAGMQQFKQYYIHPEAADKDFGGRNIVTVQKCVRTGDIDEVGDATHLTFLEMLGNFSFGGYGRREAITYAHDFIIKELDLEISYVTVYKGEGIVPQDDESRAIWNELGIKDIRLDGSDVFWGPTGGSGPCGPTTEIYCKNSAGDDVEIWNIVFNEYFCNHSREKLDKGEATLQKLDILGIDTGMGLERLLAIAQKEKSVYETDLFNPALEKINFERENLMSATFKDAPINAETFKKRTRIIADHLRTIIFLVSEGIRPGSNKREYILRRLMRRIMGATSIEKFVDEVFFIYTKIYKDVYELDLENTKLVFWKEFQDFKSNSDPGFKEIFKKYIEGTGTFPANVITGGEAFYYLSTYSITKEAFLDNIEQVLKMGMWILSKNFNEEYEQALKKHQALSRTSSAGMFKGGLANINEKTTKLHTVHHLLLAGLQANINPHIKQEGSNITEERLRLDFLCDHKLTDEEKQKVENWVNDKIKADLDVTRREMPLAKARKIGAEMEFGTKYPEIVSVYFIEDKDGNIISKEFCGGPHVVNTGELGTFKILKEEAISAGVRRIKAVLI